MLIAYPKIIYIQDTEPTDKTVGRLWYDNLNKKTLVSNGITYKDVNNPSLNIDVSEVNTSANPTINITFTPNTEFNLLLMAKIEYDAFRTSESMTGCFSWGVAGHNSTVYNTGAVGGVYSAQSNTKNLIADTSNLSDYLNKSSYAIYVGGYNYCSVKNIKITLEYLDNGLQTVDSSKFT